MACKNHDIQTSWICRLLCREWTQLHFCCRQYKLWEQNCQGTVNKIHLPLRRWVRGILLKFFGGPQKTSKFLPFSALTDSKYFHVIQAPEKNSDDEFAENACKSEEVYVGTKWQARSLVPQEPPLQQKKHWFVPELGANEKNVTVRSYIGLSLQPF